MFGKKHYNGILRKYVILMGTLFNDLEIDREDKDGNVVQSLKIPISYGPKERFLARIEALGESLERKVGFKLPVISFELTSFEYDSSRRLNPNQTINRVTDRDNKSAKTVNTPIPFDLGFQVALFVKNAEDGLRLLEQILPYFTPEYTATIFPLDDLEDYKDDVPIIFNGLSTQDTYEGDFESRRVLIHTLDFTLKGNVYGPIQYQSGVIKKSNVKSFVDLSTSGFDLERDIFDSMISVKPGIDANGNPTTIDSEDNRDIDDINKDDEYGYIVNKQDDQE